MGRRFIGGLAWLLATGTAAALSWWGIHSALSGTIYDPPSLLKLSGKTDADGAGPTPSRPAHLSSAAPPTAPPPSGRSGAPGARGSGSPSPTTDDSAPSEGAGGDTTAPATPPSSPTPPSNSKVQAVQVKGGQVAFDMGTSSATLISATPASGWQMQQWQDPHWIRVTFNRNGEEVSVICSWYDHAPMVETYPK
ncbi:hypothetical protein [Streptomyces sp. WZ-12]|uniref:hypothetical protein n=1 Tax=Streptomyces sp. WZ-12 TaxID=3030210 RepID=UPI002381713E|nr:hypothetical protein [Streptomyces sp. WZ-12]